MSLDYTSFFKIRSSYEFEHTAIEVFKIQAVQNPVYHNFIKLLGVNPTKVNSIAQIPFLPISFFKTENIVSSTKLPELVFTSSGTTGTEQSKHFVSDIQLYKDSFTCGFNHFYGSPADFTFLALLPGYLERTGSSLIYMMKDLIMLSGTPESGFYLNDHEKLARIITELESKNRKTILIGVSFALLDFIENYHFNLQNTIVMETGGMKGRRKELVREELHGLLKKGFGVNQIHSEYGMTELLSQAYSKGEGRFYCPPWMKVSIRDTEDPLSLLPKGKSGGINVIDLANLNSCSFIATQDLGKTYEDGSFEILGRFDNSDIRGCNLMVL
ncbi:acyl transferase [Namhaeicola litoreus]|uniref:Acyl transferase n=1 Tax=Namhaeicola litoreus TaxID=1052145 RepID=A0ABW3Y0H8_9FLAO